MANRTEIATAMAIAMAIVEDSFCQIISIDAFCVGGVVACKSRLLCSSVAQIGEPARSARSGDGAKRG